MSKDASTLKAAARPPDPAAASAAAGLAKLYPQLLPILIKDYVSVPGPPAPLSADWLRYGELQRQELPEVSSALVALTNVYSALSQYERTGSLTNAQQALAEESLAGADQNGYYALHQTATVLATALALPKICISPPALAPLGGYLLP